MNTKKEAVIAAKELVKKMKGKGWKYDVWNISVNNWYYRVHNSGLSIYPSNCALNGTMYYALLSSSPDGSGGQSFWTVSYTSADPNEVARRQIKLAKQFIDKLNKVAKSLDKIYQ